MNDWQITRAAQLLEAEFGPDWRTVAGMLGTEGLRKRVGKELTSFLAFPDRGDGGNNRWRGNCSPEVVASILKYVLDCKQYEGKDTSRFTLLDPMSGSGTSKAAADRFQVRSLLYDLNPAPAFGRGNWNALRDDVEDSADLIFFHPPYHTMIAYSGNVWGNAPHPDDLSRCASYEEFLDKLNYCIRKFFLALRKDGRLAVLVGDIRMNGRFYSMQNDLMRMGDFESFLVKGQFNCTSDTRRYQLHLRYQEIPETVHPHCDRISAASEKGRRPAGAFQCPADWSLFRSRHGSEHPDLASPDPDDDGKRRRHPVIK